MGKILLTSRHSVNAFSDPYQSWTWELVEASKSWLPFLLLVVYGLWFSWHKTQWYFLAISVSMVYRDFHYCVSSAGVASGEEFSLSVRANWIPNISWFFYFPMLLISNLYIVHWYHYINWIRYVHIQYSAFTSRFNPINVFSVSRRLRWVLKSVKRVAVLTTLSWTWPIDKSCWS